MTYFFIVVAGLIFLFQAITGIATLEMTVGYYVCLLVIALRFRSFRADRT